MSCFGRFITDEGGATAIEYGLIAALVSGAVIVSLQELGPSLKATYQGFSAAMNR